MEISADSFHNLLRRISEAVRVKESAIVNYQNLLQETFEQRAPYDEKHPDPGKISVDNLLSEKVSGRDHEKQLLLSRLINDLDTKLVQFSVIPIIGARGIGKTTLARLVYEDKVVKEHFELRAWVKVEEQNLNLQHAAHGIMKSALGMSCSIHDLHELDELLRDTLHSQRCLIVFDGIESVALDLWQHMNQHWFNFVDLGSIVLLTTPNKDVAANSPFLELTPLSWGDSLSLCGFQLEFDSTEDIKNISSPMAKNLSALCQGNPLALELVGSMMRYDEKLREILHSMDFSDVIVLDVSVPILLCVWVLPLHLRQCLAFCAIFPKGYALIKEKIIDMWIAHGLVNPSSDSKDGNLEDIGNIYFHQLLCRSFFTDITCNEYGDITDFRMSGLIHENLLDLARILWKDKVGMIFSVNEDASQLSLSFPFTETSHSNHLQFLILSPITYLGDCSLDHSLHDFKGLQSLDLSCSSISNLSDDICALKELRHLNLSYTLLENLPDSITNLSQLQTLDLSWCYHLNVLPEGTGTLIHMRHLDLSRCDSLSYLPSGIGFLRSLTSMPLFVLGKDHCASLVELGPLNKLGGNLEIRNLENAKRVNEAQDAKLDDKNLHHLGLSWSQNADNCFEILELLEPNVQLQEVDITGYSGSRFPRWISSINGLTKISITECGSKNLPSLGQLPVLKELQLKGMTNLERIGPEFYGNAITDVFFPSLQQFGLYDLRRLTEWSGETSPNSSGISFQCLFHSLKTLTIEACPKLTSLPPLPTLSDMIVVASNKTILSSLASFTSLSSLLVNDMELGVSNFQDLTWLDSLKKLILCNVKDKLIVNISHIGTTFTALQHFSILHCHQLTDLCLFYFSSLQKLHVIDCPNLFRILVREEEEMPLAELVIEDCPEVFSEVCFDKFPSLRKLIAKNCSGDFTIYYAGDYKKLEKLEYLFVSGCSRVEMELQAFPALVSHIPCIIVGDHKVNYDDMKDLIEVPTRASYEFKAEDLLHQRSHIKVTFSTQLHLVYYLPFLFQRFFNLSSL